MNERLNLEPIPAAELQQLKGVFYPASMKFRQLIITGPPGSGKTGLMARVGGWPEEGYVDLMVKNWWRDRSLTYRPREVHLGFPFAGFDQAMTVFDKAWLEASAPPRLDLSRIVLPPARTHFLAVDWRQRFVFEFLIPPPEAVLEWRLERSRRVVHPVDRGVTLDQVEKQVAVYRDAALHFHRSGLPTYVRDDYDGVPMNIVDMDETGARRGKVQYWGG